MCMRLNLYALKEVFLTYFELANVISDTEDYDSDCITTKRIFCINLEESSFSIIKRLHRVLEFKGLIQPLYFQEYFSVLSLLLTIGI